MTVADLCGHVRRWAPHNEKNTFESRHDFSHSTESFNPKRKLEIGLNERKINVGRTFAVAPCASESSKRPTSELATVTMKRCSK